MYQRSYRANSPQKKHFRFRPRKKGQNFRQEIDRSYYISKAVEFTKIEEVKNTGIFKDFGFQPLLLQNIGIKGYLKPTEIQHQTIPWIMESRDVLGIANTGTGKTAAYILPIINKILLNQEEKILVLAPTRELAMQIKEELRSFTYGMRVFVALVIGGANIREQIIKIRRGPHILIGTPGRILDLNKRKVVDFSKMTMVVLDEVDRMLDMGFIGDIRNIVEQTPRSRQTLFFTATMDKKIEPLANTFLNNPVKISTKIQDSSSHVEQNIVRVERHKKEERLHQLVGNPDFRKVLVFGSTQRIVDKLTVGLVLKGFKASGLHGGKKQNQRQQIVKSFKENLINILVATDVAARGLDIADITHVINYDEPNNYDDYVHRVGRTGRGNNMGMALTFVE